MAELKPWPSGMLIISVLEIGDETGEGVACLPAGQYDFDVKSLEDDSCSPRAGHISAHPERPTSRSSHSGRCVRRYGGGLPCHVTMKNRKTLAHYKAAR